MSGACTCTCTCTCTGNYNYLHMSTGIHVPCTHVWLRVYTGLLTEQFQNTCMYRNFFSHCDVTQDEPKYLWFIIKGHKITIINTGKWKAHLSWEHFSSMAKTDTVYVLERFGCTNVPGTRVSTWFNEMWVNMYCIIQERNLAARPYTRRVNEFGVQKVENWLNRILQRSFLSPRPP